MMDRSPWLRAAGLAFVLASSPRVFASTCAIGTAASPTANQLSAQEGLFTWTISDIHVAVANVNVTPAVLTLNAVAAGVPGADQLQLTEQVAPPSGNSLTNGMPLILDLSFDLTVTSTLPPRTPGGATPPQNTALQTYLNGLLLATVASHGFVPGIPGVDGTFLNQQTTVAVNEIFIVSENSGVNMFSETFDMADPGKGGGSPPSAPEPASLLLLGLGALLAALSGVSVQINRYFAAS